MAVYAQQIMQFGLGHLALFFSMAFYLGWWFVFFSPDARKEKPTGAKRRLGLGAIVLAGIFGAGYLGLIVQAVFTMPVSIPLLIVVFAALILFVLLLGISYVIMGRKLTAELPLLMLWFMVELFFLDALASSGAVVGSRLIMLGLPTAIVFIAGVVCYCSYYRMSGKRAFVCGAIPLGAIGALSAIIALLVH